MYTREQARQLRQEFWTAFGQYLAPHPSATGQKVNWINYKTGYRSLYFRMDADRDRAYIGIVMAQRDPDLQQLFYEQFLELRGPLHGLLDEAWQWEEDATDEHGRAIRQIYTTQAPVNIFRKEDWPAIIAFLKPRILALDEFWSLAQDHFAPLRAW
ncbi:MAG: DUF4268 domain-containing protein [Lewinella sp.]|nr:DUF4268 domain-containing protein [Lewinella sp.]